MSTRLLLVVVWTLLFPLVTARYQWTSWSRPSDCSRTCGEGVSSRIRECKPTGEDSQEGENDCPGAATIEEICFKPPCPLDPNKANCNCGCLLTQSSGSLRSRLSSKDMFCHWVIKTQPGTKPILSINNVKNFDWKSGGIYISTGGSEHHRYTEQDGVRLKKDFPFVIRGDGNVMNVSLHYSKKLNVSQMVELDASYTSTKVAVVDEAKQTLNLPAIIGIAACAAIILIASIIAICRRMRNTSNSDKTKEEKPQEEFEDASSVSGSNRSCGKHHKHNGTHASSKTSYSTPYSTGTLSQEERERLLATVNNDMFLQKEGSMVSGMPPVGYLPPGQAYVNYPVQNGQIVQPVHMIHAQSTLTIQQLPQPAINYMIQQTQMSYNRQLPYEHSMSGTPYDYATSGTEG